MVELYKKVEDLKEYFNFDIYADIYDKTRNVSKSFQSIFSLIFKKAGIIKNSRSIILEVGSGTGIVIDFLSKSKKFFPKYIGIDISLGMLKKIKQKYQQDKLDLLIADAYSLPFKENIFDLALMVRTIHILSRWRDALKEVKQSLKNRNLLVIITGGPGTKIFNECPSNDKYIILRKEFGYPIFYYGADWSYVPDFIQKELNGHNIEILRGTHIVIKNLKNSINEFENQLMTWHTQVPKKIHDNIIEQLKKFILEKYGSINIEEEQLVHFIIGFIKFN